ncbi:WD40/YVTN/BNR-like repeat-containing protein [Dyella subtropica]|uniref:WD40/YVTN/BNR-like repeat-containing protein n=1 Tax=Dyella subtropica TaxID=2992127 RepID=UPI0022565E82|nr:hypothetical protein [Dyella subtropica]
MVSRTKEWRRLALLASSIALTAACTTLPRTNDGAATLTPAADAHWQKLPTEAFKGKQDDIQFVDRDTGFYVNGKKGSIWRSHDSGRSWQRVLEQPGTYFRAIGMLDPQHGFAGNLGTDYFPGVTDPTPLYETNDGGDSWHAVMNLPGPAIKGICAIDVQKVHYIDAGKIATHTMIHAAGRVGGPAYLLRSLDGGNSWANIDMNPWVAMIVDVKFFDEMNGIVFAGSDANIDRSHALIVATHDGGKTWQKVYESKRPGELIWKGSFPTRQIGYATIQGDSENKDETQQRIAKTTDGGMTWKELPLVNDAKVREFGIGFANAQLGWVGTSQGGFETRDGGAHWQPIEFGRVVNKIRIMPDGDGHFVGYAIGSDVYTFAPPLGLPAAPADTAAIKVVKP